MIVELQNHLSPSTTVSRVPAKGIPLTGDPYKWRAAVYWRVSTAARTLFESTGLFDRNRLLVDLDEATDPDSPPSVLVVVGLRGLGESSAESGLHPIVSQQLRERFAAIVGTAGATYSTRSSELCAILDGTTDDVVETLGAIHAGFAGEAASVDVRVSMGFVELPRDAEGAPEALTLTDRRMTSADGPIRFD